MDFHLDDFAREEWIARYLRRRLDPARTEEFESHYLECDECFNELRAAELLIEGLVHPSLERRDLNGVTMLDFTAPVQLTAGSIAFTELSNVLEQKDTKVLIDLERVSRIDSAGLGLLMSCYSHVIRQQGAFKLLRPSEHVEKLLHMTGIGTVLESYRDESEALSSFHS